MLAAQLKEMESAMKKLELETEQLEQEAMEAGTFDIGTCNYLLSIRGRDGGVQAPLERCRATESSFGCL